VIVGVGMPNRGFTLSNPGVLAMMVGGWIGLYWIGLGCFSSALKARQLCFTWATADRLPFAQAIDNGAGIKKLTKCNCFIGAKMVFGVLHQ